MRNRRPCLRLAFPALSLTLVLTGPAFGAARPAPAVRPAPPRPEAGWLEWAWKALPCLVLPARVCPLPVVVPPGADDTAGGSLPAVDYGCGSDPNGSCR
jgi:hypothetical protein